MSRLSVALLVAIGVLGGAVLGARWDEVVALVAPPPLAPPDADALAATVPDSDGVADTDRAPAPTRPHTPDRAHSSATSAPTIPFAATPAGVQGLFDTQARRLEHACYARFRHRAQATGTQIADFTFHVWIDPSPDAPGVVHIATAPETDAVLTTEGRAQARLEAACLVRALVGARAEGPVPPRTTRTIPLYGKTPLGGMTFPRFSVKLPVFLR